VEVVEQHADWLDVRRPADEVADAVVEVAPLLLGRQLDWLRKLREALAQGRHQPRYLAAALS
jgi:hypothetical protein